MSSTPIAYAINSGSGTQDAVGAVDGTPGEKSGRMTCSIPYKIRTHAVGIRMIATMVLAGRGRTALVAVTNSANAPKENVVSRAARLQAMRTAGCVTALGRSISSTNSPNMTARQSDDQR